MGPKWKEVYTHNDKMSVTVDYDVMYVYII